MSTEVSLVVSGMARRVGLLLERFTEAEALLAHATRTIAACGDDSLAKRFDALEIPAQLAEGRARLLQVQADLFALERLV